MQSISVRVHRIQPTSKNFCPLKFISRGLIAMMETPVGLNVYRQLFTNCSSIFFWLEWKWEKINPMIWKRTFIAWRGQFTNLLKIWIFVPKSKIYDENGSESRCFPNWWSFEQKITTVLIFCRHFHVTWVIFCRETKIMGDGVIIGVWRLLDLLFEFGAGQSFVRGWSLRRCFFSFLSSWVTESKGMKERYGWRGGEADRSGKWNCR